MPVNQATLRWWPMIQEAAKRHGLDPTLLLGLVDFESSGKPDAQHPTSKATGLGQVMPRESGFRDRPTAAQLMDPATNLEWSARIFKAGLDRYKDEDKALAAYLGAIDARGNITGAVDANGTGGNQYIRTVRQRQSEFAPVVGTADVGRTVSGTSGVPRLTTQEPAPPRPTPPSPTGTRRPPSAAAQAAAARAAASAAEARRSRTETPSSLGGATQRAAVGRFDGRYVSPVDGAVTTQYGGKQTYSEGKTTSIGSFNHGTDIAAAAGTDVRAPVGGIVTAVYNSKLDDRKGQRNAEENSGWGGSITIKGDDGKTHHLSHAQYGSILVKPGERVEQGQPTHKVGMSGNATGPHVDWEKWNGDVSKGQSEDPLAAPLIKSSEGAKLYQEALARAKQANQGAGTPAAQSATSAGAPAEGAQDVSNTAGTSPTLAFYEQQERDTQARLTAAKGNLKQHQDALTWARERLRRAETAGNAQEKADAKAAIVQLDGPPDKPGTGLIADAQDEIAALEKDAVAFGARRAEAATVDAKNTLSPQEAERYTAETAKIKAETERLKRELENGGVDPATRANIESQIAARETELELRGQELNQRQREYAGGQRGRDAQAAQDEWAVAEGQATLPYTIDRIIAQTDLDSEQAARLREMLPYELDKISGEVYRLQQLTPIEIQQGKADVELTRQRASEIRQLIAPRVQQALAAAGVDTANAARINQMLPWEIASAKTEIGLRQAQTGLTQQQTNLTYQQERRAKVEADILGRKDRSWSEYVEWVQGNPNASDEQRNAKLMGLVQDVQDYATVYRNELDRQIASSEQLQRSQGLQIEQQQADTQQFTAAENAAANLRAQRTADQGQLVSSFGGEGNLSGPQGRLAALSAAAPLLNEQGLRDFAGGSGWGTTELNAVQAGMREHLERVKQLSGMGPAGGIRQAPTITAPPPIGMRFNMPGSTAPGARPEAPPNNPPATVAPPPPMMTAPPDPTRLVIPGSPTEDELRRASRTSSGRIGGV